MSEEEARDKLLTPRVSAPFLAAVRWDAQLPMEFDSPPPRTSILGPVARPQEVLQLYALHTPLWGMLGPWMWTLRSRRV